MHQRKDQSQRPSNKRTGSLGMEKRPSPIGKNPNPVLVISPEEQRTLMAASNHHQVLQQQHGNQKRPVKNEDLINQRKNNPDISASSSDLQVVKFGSIEKTINRLPPMDYSKITSLHSTKKTQDNSSSITNPQSAAIDNNNQLDIPQQLLPNLVSDKKEMTSSSPTNQIESTVGYADPPPENLLAPKDQQMLKDPLNDSMVFPHQQSEMLSVNQQHILSAYQFGHHPQFIAPIGQQDQSPQFHHAQQQQRLYRQQQAQFHHPMAQFAPHIPLQIPIHHQSYPQQQMYSSFSSFQQSQSPFNPQTTALFPTQQQHIPYTMFAGSPANNGQHAQQAGIIPMPLPSMPAHIHQMQNQSSLSTLSNNQQIPFNTVSGGLISERKKIILDFKDPETGESIMTQSLTSQMSSAAISTKPAPTETSRQHSSIDEGKKSQKEEVISDVKIIVVEPEIIEELNDADLSKDAQELSSATPLEDQGDIKSKFIPIENCSLLTTSDDHPNEHSIIILSDEDHEEKEDSFCHESEPESELDSEQEQEHERISILTHNSHVSYPIGLNVSRVQPNQRKIYSIEFLYLFADLCKELPQGVEEGEYLTGFTGGVSLNYLTSGSSSAGYSSSAHSSHRGSINAGHGHANNARSRRRESGSGPAASAGACGDGAGSRERLNQSSFTQLSNKKNRRGTIGTSSTANSNITGAGRRQSSSLLTDSSSPTTDSSFSFFQVGDNAWSKSLRSKELMGEDEVTKRKFMGILNKMSKDNFEELYIQIKQLPFSNVSLYSEIISKIYDKAVDESNFAEMYARLVQRLAVDYRSFPDVDEAVVKKTGSVTRALLLGRCQSEYKKRNLWACRSFEEMCREAEINIDAQAPIDKPEDMGLEDYWRGRLKKRSLGNLKFVGELFKLGIIHEKIILSCVSSLFEDTADGDSNEVGSDSVGAGAGVGMGIGEEELESVAKLLFTTGNKLDASGNESVKGIMNGIFEKLKLLATNTVAVSAAQGEQRQSKTAVKISSRIKFLLLDLVELRANRWKSKAQLVKDQQTHTGSRSGTKGERESFSGGSSASQGQQSINDYPSRRILTKAPAGGPGNGSTSSISTQRDRDRERIRGGRGAQFAPKSSSSEQLASKGGKSSQSSLNNNAGVGDSPLTVAATSTATTASTPITTTPTTIHGPHSQSKYSLLQSMEEEEDQHQPLPTTFNSIIDKDVFEGKFSGLLKEYILLKDVNEVTESLKDWNFQPSASHPLYIELIVRKALSNSRRTEVDLLVELLRELYFGTLPVSTASTGESESNDPWVISNKSYWIDGYRSGFDNVEDIAIDVPNAFLNAAVLLKLFIKSTESTGDADTTGKDGYIFPSKDFVATEILAGCSPATIDRIFSSF